MPVTTATVADAVGEVCDLWGVPSVGAAAVRLADGTRTDGARVAGGAIASGT